MCIPFFFSPSFSFFFFLSIEVWVGGVGEWMAVELGEGNRICKVPFLALGKSQSKALIHWNARN